MRVQLVWRRVGWWLGARARGLQTGHSGSSPPARMSSASRKRRAAPGSSSVVMVAAPSWRSWSQRQFLERHYKVASCSENPYARSCRSGALAKISCVKLAPNHTPLVSTHLQNANGKSTLNTPRHAASRTQQLAEHGRTLTVALARSPCADSTMPPAQVRLLPHSHAPEQPRAPAGVAHVHPVHPLLWLCPRA